MRIAVAGAGAIGGTIAGLLARAGGHEVSVLARGPHLAAIRARGLTFETETGTTVHRLAASDDPAALGGQDIVILAAKGHGVPGLAPLLAPLLGPRTIVLCAQNGIPWWFFAGLDVPERDRPLPVWPRRGYGADRDAASRCQRASPRSRDDGRVSAR